MYNIRDHYWAQSRPLNRQQQQITLYDIKSKEEFIRFSLSLRNSFIQPLKYKMT